MIASKNWTSSWRLPTTSIRSLDERWAAWPAICAEDLRVVGDPLEVVIAEASTISPATADRLLGRRAPQLADDVAPWLLPHQREAAGRLYTLLECWSGAVLADATGLGKTYVALAVALALDQRTSVIAPAALKQQWIDAARRTGLAIAFSSMESLSRGNQPTEGGFAVVDEAHRFRNPQTRRYDVLARWILGRKLLLLTATPVVNRVADVVALLRLFLHDDALRAAGIVSLRDLERQPELIRKAWRVVAVARDARQAGVAAALPRRRLATPLPAPPVPPERLTQLIDLIDQLETPGADEPRALLRLLLLRALASSSPALRASVQNHLRFIEHAIEASHEGLALPRRTFRRLVAAGDPDQLAFLPLLLEVGARPIAEQALRRDGERLRQIWALAACHDPKARALHSILEARTKRGKAVVFVNSVETARYLARRLRTAVALTGAGGWTPSGRLPATDALRPFQPLGQPAPHMDARVLVATDVAGEGLDLQGANLVIHYDLPWTPTRLAQRLGRVRRLGSLHRVVEECAFVPVAPLADRLQLVERLLEKERIGRAASHVVALSGAALRPSASRSRRGRQPARPEQIHLVYRLVVGGYGHADSLPDLPLAAAVSHLRSRLRAATRPAESPAAVRLARKVLLTAASRAAKERSNHILHQIERALARLTLGLNAGELLALEDAIATRYGRLRRLVAWSDLVGDRPSGAPSLEVFLVACTEG